MQGFGEKYARPTGERGRFFDKRLAAPTLHLPKHNIPLLLIQIENAALRIRRGTGRGGADFNGIKNTKRDVSARFVAFIHLDENKTVIGYFSKALSQKVVFFCESTCIRRISGSAQ